MVALEGLSASCQIQAQTFFLAELHVWRPFSWNIVEASCEEVEDEELSCVSVSC